ncbi:MAG: PAS domain S-box protein [Blastocatellia bacterium]
METQAAINLLDGMGTGEQYREIFELNPLPMGVIDLDTLTIIAVNQAAVSHYGYAREQIEGFPITDLYRAEERPRVRERVGKHPEAITRKSMLRHRVRDGRIINVEVFTHKVTWFGKPALLAIVEDVTERLRAERELRQSEERYRRLFEITPVPMWVYDIETLDFLAVNKAALRHYGYSRAEFLSMKATDIRPADEVSRFITLNDRDPGGLKNSGVWKHRKKDGAIIQVVITSQELSFGGRPGRLVVANDMTARKHVEESLRNYTDRLRIQRDIDQAILAARSPRAIARAILPGLQRLIPHDRASVVVVNEDTGQMEFLTVFSRMEGGFREGAVTSYDKAGANLFRQMRAHIIQDLETEDPGYPGLDEIREEGLRSYVMVPMVVNEHLLGSLNFGSLQPGAYGEKHADIARDIADTLALAIQNARLYEAEQRARAAAEAADRLKDEFLATVSHELRSPLNAILGWNHLLRSGNVNPEIQQRAIETIERNARAQAQLVNDLLDVSRIVSGKLRLSITEIDLIPVIVNALDSVRPAAAAKGISLETAFASTPALVSGDPDRLQQVMWNLLHNAVKFTPANGLVSVSLARASDRLELAVRDNGRGVSPDFLPFVFDRFRQAERSITRSHGGLGLGLSIVRHLVELHGGTVSVASPGEGLGATFSVTLPVPPSSTLVPPEIRETEPGESAAGAILSGLRVLVVEDDSDPTRAT